jgi:hypothetical protein
MEKQIMEYILETITNTSIGGLRFASLCYDVIFKGISI